MKGRTRTLAYGWLAVVALAAAASSACHEEGDVRVANLGFEGNQAFSSGRLSDVIVTRTSGRLPWARPRYFNRSVFEADLARIKSFYDDRGYPDARVTSTDVTFNEKRDAVRLRVHIDEGTPLLVERVAFTGLDQAPPEVSDALESMPLRPGMPRDRQLVAATRERVAFLLRDHGYPNARAESQEAPGSQPKRVVVTIAATSGPGRDLRRRLGRRAVVGPRIAGPADALVRGGRDVPRESRARESAPAAQARHFRVRARPQRSAGRGDAGRPVVCRWS